ncbi:hypothetical protein [Staphylococcus epidermidis]|uniref:hypothetical protein n=1 Tax=Staphylococcus epidermidis TaxID=1282 RepID=UPI00136E7E29|nr:hypothetical protein [Staphylococcus epidermidis]NAM28990.1 hypothetical protein [Staphylococcus epidermidis]NAM65882.1 hypothetical protein [Staphylococcus epidermidis]NAM77752.1 hypothetical protein [Staphylococcus epidermidis]
MTKIKVKKELKPKEFLKYLLEQEETEVELNGYTFDYNRENYSFDPEITANEVISYDAHSGTFTVEVEEEIDENTVFPVLVKTLKNTFNEITVISFENASINSSKSYNETISYHILNDEGTMTLIWKDGAMVDD